MVRLYMYMYVADKYTECSGVHVYPCRQTRERQRVGLDSSDSVERSREAMRVSGQLINNVHVWKYMCIAH